MSGARETEPWRSTVKERGSMIMTLLMDTAVILVATGCRWLILWTSAALTPGDSQDWAIQKLEWIVRWGLISAAGALTAFDVAKIIVRAWKELFASLRS